MTNSNCSLVCKVCVGHTLTLTYQTLWDEVGDGEVARLDLRALNVGQDYWVAVESFNEAGVSKRSRPIRIR